jgi:hypothetical protein
MPSNFGPRNADRENQSEVDAAAAVKVHEWTTPRSSTLQRATIASSRLVVVRAFLIASQIKARLAQYGVDVSFEERSWSDSIITDIARGHLMAAVYNKQRGDKNIESEALDVLNIGLIGHSMGGRNFCALVHSEGRWCNTAISDLAGSFESAPVIVGRNTDRFTNVLEVFGVENENGLTRRGITVVDIADASPEILAGMKDALMVCGQNRRLEARSHSGVVELQGFADLPQAIKVGIRNRSANSLFVSPALLESIHVSGEALFGELTSAFDRSWRESYEDCLELVSHESEFESLEPDERTSAVSLILFETYRVGLPQ